MEEKTFTHPSTVPPPINGKEARWAYSHDIEAVCTLGMEIDDITILPMDAEASQTYEYRRVSQNKWALMQCYQWVAIRDNYIIWTSSILKSKVRPDVAIVNPSSKKIMRMGKVVLPPKSFFTWSN